MRGRCSAVLALTAALLLISNPALGDEAPLRSDLALVQQYAPVLYFHPEEVFRPQPVEVILQQARLRRSRRLWFDADILISPDPLDLLRVGGDRSYFLDIWYGEEGSSSYLDYSTHRTFYRAALSPQVGGAPITVYARVVREETGGATLQYWAFYYYNDWFNKHEGDWEMVQVMLDAEDQPKWVVLSQHHGGTRRAWAATRLEDSTHPAVHVALGSHANYFVGNETYPNTKMVGDRAITILDRTGSAGRVLPEVILLPERERLREATEDWSRAAWLAFRGRWGEIGAQGDLSGPLGPADKGQQWDRPYDWGLTQPMDTDTWYTNRVRVEVVGDGRAAAHVELADRHGGELSAIEGLGSLVVLHSDPPREGLVATIQVSMHTRADVIAAWPERRLEHVTHFRFEDVDFGETGLARLELGSGATANLLLGCHSPGEGATLACVSSAGPTETTTVEATWDVPDVIWVGGLLPAHRVGMVLLLAVMLSVAPTALYVGGLYWLDRYEKEPHLLVAAAFIWGSVPAVVVALAAEVFLGLPPDLMGARALVAAPLGLVAAVLQEALKGAAVLFVSIRYRHEFDDPLDGIVYGAVVGFGFAMMRNLIDLVSSCAVYGFAGFGLDPYVEGLLYSLDHGLYTATFGAALGAARLSRVRWRRRVAPAAGFALAVTAHALRNLSTWNVLGVDPVRVLTTCSGVGLLGVVACWSLRRQREALRLELKGELPGALYHALLTPGGRTRAQWQALRAGGLIGLRRTRRLHQRCTELALRKMERSLGSTESELNDEIEQLSKEIHGLKPN